MHAIVLALTAIMSSAAATEPCWPFLRGPNYDGHSAETGLAAHWPAAGLPLLWHVDLGQGFSGFVVRGDRVFTQRQSLAGQFVICLDAWSGKTLWEYRYDYPFEPTGLYPGPRSTPTLARDQVYFATPGGVVGCLTEAGRLVWQVNLQATLGAFDLGFGYACSPVVVDDLVVLTVGARGASLVALDADTGKTVWQAGDDRASYTPALPIKHRGRTLLIGHLENSLVAHDLATGQREWRLPLSQGYDEHSAWPIYAEPHLWISAPFQAGSRLLELREGEPPAAIWKQRLMSNDVASSVLVGGHVYGFDLREPQVRLHRTSRGQYRCLEFLTGKECWATSAVAHATTIVADGKLILLTDTGDLVLAQATPERYHELARCSILPGEIGWTAPALCGKRLFARNHSRAVCVYLGFAEELAAQHAERETRTTLDLPPDRARTWPELLGIDPRMALAVPDNTQLRRWFWIGLSTLLLASVGSTAVMLTVRVVRPRTSFASLTAWRDGLLRGTAFVAGCAGTTAFSHLGGDFAFTWMTAVFVLFDWASARSFSRGDESAGAWQRRRVDLVFVAGCLAYFEICRHWSLIFAWFFLPGFLAAIPLLWLGYRWRPTSVVRWIAADLARVAAYAAMSLAGALLLRWYAW